jgi:hypothetical protein
MEDDLKKMKLEDDFHFFLQKGKRQPKKNGRRPPTKIKEDLNKNGGGPLKKNGRRPQTKKWNTT